MTQGYSTLLLTFNAPTALVQGRRLDTEVPEGVFACDRLFSAATLATLGAFPECKWLSNGRNVQVSLGSSPTIKLGDQVETLSDVLTINERVVDLPVKPTPTLAGAVFSNDPLVQPQAALLASPLSVQECGRLVVSGATSLGGAGRPMSTAWTVRNNGSASSASSGSAGSVLEEQLQALADSQTGLSLEFSQLQFFNAVQALKASMGSSFYTTPIQLEIVGTVKNWLDQTDTASIVVNVETSQEPMPIVSPTSPTATTILNSEQVSFSVETRYADTSSCDGATSSTPEQVVVTWEYRQGSGDWADLSTSGLTDLDRRPGGIRFAPFSFQTSTSHEFRVTARYETSSLTALAPQYVFALTVSPPAPPMVRIVGPSAVSDACAFSLDASGSFDPSVAGTTADLAFAWSCTTASANYDCSQLPNFAASATSTTSQLAVAGGQLQEGLYNFSVQVSRAGGGASELLWQVEVSAGALPPVAIAVPWGSGEAVSTQVGGQLTNPSATVQGGEGCSVPSTWAWKFILLEDGPDLIQAFLNTTSTAQTDLLTLTTADFRGDAMVPGKSYAYAVLQTSTEEEMISLQLARPENLNQALALGAKAVKSLPFVADGPPSGGLVQSSPQSGYAVTTSFSGTTSAWYDEDASSLTFAYYLLPLRQNITLTSDGNGGILVDGTFRPPDVEWLDTRSPIHWAALGGLFLTNVSDPSASQWEVQMALGSYVMAVVARDRLGAISAAFTPGPLVESPPGGLSPAAAVSSLDSALSSGDETVILGALNAVSSLSLASDDPTEVAQATAKKMEALSSASGVIGSSSESLGQFGDVASNILKSEGSGAGVASAEVADQAAGALGNALDAATEGVNPAAAKSLLGAATSVGDSFSSDTSTSSIAQGARSAQLRVLFSKLGSALLQQVPAGSTSTVSTVEGGKGTAIAVAKEDAAAAAASGLSSGAAQIPGGGLGARLRRLQGDSCSTIAAQSTDFVGSNPFTYLQSSIGQNAYVENSATVTTLEIKRCDSLVRHSNWDPPIALTLPLNAAPGTPPEGYSYEPVCVRLDETSTDLPKQEWTTDSMTWLLPTSYDATTVECFAATGGGSYAAIYVPVKLEATFTSTTGTTTRTYMTTETSTSIPAIPATDGGMVVGVTLAAVALIVVVSVIGWQCYVGNVKVQKPEMPQKIMKQVSENCQRMKDKMRKSKVGIEPSTEPKEAWESKPQASGRAQQDAADHFWDWANDLVKEGQGTPSGPPSKAFSVRSKSGSPPHLPPRFAVPKPSVEKQEYFQNFAQELRDIVSAGMPGMIADSPDSPADIVPPPPPKRSVPSAPPRPPPSPPPWVRESAALSTLPPPMVNAEKIEVRVDQAFSDWKNDFAVATLGSMGSLGSSLGSSLSLAKLAPGAPGTPGTEDPPPPPPQPREVKQLPVPPPRPGRRARAPQSPTRALPSPPGPSGPGPSPGTSPPSAPAASGTEPTLRSTAKAPPLPVAAMVGNLPMPPLPPREASHSSLPLSPPSFKEGSQLSMAVPKHQPLHPPLPKGAPIVELPGAMDSGQVESERTSTD